MSTQSIYYKSKLYEREKIFHEKTPRVASEQIPKKSNSAHYNLQKTHKNPSTLFTKTIYRNLKVKTQTKPKNLPS